MLGVLANTATVLVGSIIGILFNKKISQKMADTIMTGLGLCVVYIGISGALKNTNPLILVISISVGIIIGESIDIHSRIEALANMLQNRFSKGDGRVSIAEGFITASLVFCVGAMTVVGSLEAGIMGDNKTLYTKALLDMVSATIFGASLGVGVALSAAFVFVFQGSIVLTAQFIAPFLSDYVIIEMGSVGSLLILAVGLNLAEITKIRAANFMPAILMPVILCNFM